MVDIYQIKEKFLRLKGKKESIEERLDKTNHQIESNEKTLLRLEKAREIIQTVAQQTQKKLEFHISNLVTTALYAVIDDPPEFVVKIEIRRNQSECDLLFKKDGVFMKPIDSEAGGILDITSFALRTAYWSLKKNRNTLLLDEPFRNASYNYQSKVSAMVKMLSHKSKLQIIMVSHIPEAIEQADKVFDIRLLKANKY